MRKLFASLICMGSITAIAGQPVVPALKECKMIDKLGQFSKLSVSGDFSEARKIFVKNASKLEGVVDADTAFLGLGSNVIFVEKVGLGDEGYEITIDEKVTVSATKYAGAYYGAQTLLQLLATDGKGQLPLGVIKDSPAYPVRSMLLDVGRKFISVDGLKDWIRMLGYTKMNELHLHLNDNSWGKYPGYRLESKKFPGLASEDGFYTFKEIRELQDFAKLRGVTIVPEIDSPGHALGFTMYRPDLAMPEMNRSGFGLAYLDLGNPDAIKFMEDVFDEVAPLFDTPYFHIGTDEYRLNLIKDKTKRDHYGELFRKYINHMNAYLHERHGKTVRIWSGYEHMPGKTEPDTSVVIDMWETSDAVAKSTKGYQFVNSSHYYTYIVPGMPYYGVNNGYIYNDWNPRVFNKSKPKTGILPKEAPGLLGAKLHVWNDAGPTGYTWNEIARLTWPSMFAMSEKMWGEKGSVDYSAFVKRIGAISTKSGISLLDRPVTADETGLVWQKEKGDKYFIANTHQNLNISEKAEDLEYPWTAEFTLTRTSDTIGKDTLISSDLAAFYVDMEHTVKDNKTKKDVTQRGVACVRAQQAPGYEPLLSNRPDVLVFNYQVPFDEKVTLKFVGERRQTSLYVNGKLIEKKRIQMICPLKRLGAQNAESFQGILHDAKITNEANTPKVTDKWAPNHLKSTWTEFVIDVTKEITEVGRKTVSFEYTRGGCRLDIQKVELLESGKVIQTDDHYGITGSNSKDNIFSLKLAKLNAGEKYEIRATIKADGGTDSYGNITFSE